MFFRPFFNAFGPPTSFRVYFVSPRELSLVFNANEPIRTGHNNTQPVISAGKQGTRAQHGKHALRTNVTINVWFPIDKKK